jgi:hypothetical protein
MLLKDFNIALLQRFKAENLSMKVEKVEVRLQLLNERTGEISIHKLDYRSKGAKNLIIKDVGVYER